MEASGHEAGFSFLAGLFFFGTHNSASVVGLNAADEGSLRKPENKESLRINAGKSLKGAAPYHQST